MVSQEELDIINRRLQENFGVYTDGRPKFRIVWSHDQIEKRWVSHTPEGWQLLNPVVEERPKYRQYINPPKYLLERLLEIPEGCETDLVEPTSYECIWIFETQRGVYLPPKFTAAKLVIEQLLENMANAGKKRYAAEMSPEVADLELKKVTEELFGNETAEGDALAYGSGIVVPGKDTVN